MKKQKYDELLSINPVFFLCVSVCLQRGETALHMAARAGQSNVVRYLIQNGARVDAKAKVGSCLTGSKPKTEVIKTPKPTTGTLVPIVILCDCRMSFPDMN